MVGPDIEYVKIKPQLLAEVHLAAGQLGCEFWKERVRGAERYTGRQLEGWRYGPLFAYFAARDELGALELF